MYDHVPDRLAGEVESLKQLVSKLIWTLNERSPSQTASSDTRR